jgi:hypothetical protein
MVAMFGVMGLLCCGALSVVVYGLGNQRLANNGANMPAFNQPAPVDAPNFNPPRPFPDGPPPIPGFPAADSIPFESVGPPWPGIPGTPAAAAPAPKTLDDFLQAMQTIDVTSFAARTMLEEFNKLPVEEGRRTEVVEALLKMLGRAGVHAGGILAGPGETTLENWTSKAQATSVAGFAADDANHFARPHLVKVLAAVGGDAETAKALLPLLKEPSAGRALVDVFAKIGPEAEEPLLTQLESAEHFARITLFDVLGKVGGAKTKAKLETLLKSGKGLDSGLGRKALREIQLRESKNQP